ncbi:MAG: AAA family ATPase [Holosporaceae bacterium]|jgi:pilus assembly protein CpaE|nr:AAA family ATPase [Holosporaceae bacterium]
MAADNLEELPYNLVGVVTDPVSIRILNDFVKETNLAYSEVIAGSPDDALKFIKEHRNPKTLIVDVSNSDLPLADINKIKDFSAPYVNIIVIGSRNDVGLFRDFINAGVSDYLVKPINVALIKKSIENLGNIQKSSTYEKTGKLIHVMGSVGGSGVSTTSVNIAWILANKHFKRTLIMDLDFMFGTVNTMLDIKAGNAYLDIMESPEKVDDYFIETILKKYETRLYYVGGLADLLRGVEISVSAFEILIDALKKQFNYVLVDAPRDIGGACSASIKAADILVIMIEMSVASAQNAVRILEFLRTDYSKKKVIIIANKIGLSSGGAITVQSFEKAINRPIDYMMPLDENMALAAANIGQPLAISSSPLTDILDDIADDITGKKGMSDLIKTVLKNESSFLHKIKKIFGTSDAK